MNKNRVEISGKIVAPLKLTNLGENRRVVNSRLLNEREYLDENGLERVLKSHLSIESWGSVADRLTKEILEGDEIEAVGYIKVTGWTKKGKKYNATKINTQEFNKIGPIEKAEPVGSFKTELKDEVPF